MRELLIDLDAIADNLNRMRQVAPNSKICGVVKANAYGHGMVPVAKRLEQDGVDFLGVATWPRLWSFVPPESESQSWPGCTLQWRISARPF